MDQLGTWRARGPRRMEIAEKVESMWESSHETGFVFGESPAICAVNEVISDLAKTKIPVLLVGESGTGKDVYARQIHRLSRRAGIQPFKINCRMTDDARLAAMLDGIWHQEHGPETPGTVFLDGIDELDAAAQKVLLAALAETESAQNNLESFRLISAASKDLEAEIGMGGFRSELYFRLNGACLRLPPLRERTADISKLIEYFLKKHALELRRKAPTLDNESLKLLQEYHWPGNIRELENLTRNIVAVGNADQPLQDLRTARFSQSKSTESGSAFSLKRAARAASREREKELILDALQRTRWNRKRAAQELQISYKSLLGKIKQFEMPDVLASERGRK
jgi:two-component system, NtrC family, response regulator AtoC